MRKAQLIEKLKAVSVSESNHMLNDVFLKLCESIDSPRSLSAWLLFSSGEHKQLLSLETSPENYEKSSAYADDYLVTSFLSKYKFLSVDTNLKQVAWEKFQEAERACEITNIKFRSLLNDPSKWEPSLYAKFLGARRLIHRVLGKVDLNEIAQGFGWGPGATNVAKGSSTTAYHKFQQELSVTSSALIMGHCCVNSTPAWVNCHLQSDEFPSANISLTRESFSVTRGNEIVFVPKNAKTDRTIAIEPHVNSYLQKGFGSYIRRRLKRIAGIDLNDQTINQRLARQGSLTGTLATIDLSGASDTISTEVVRFLLPSRWFQLLDSIRSKQGLIRASSNLQGIEEDQWLYYHKFSSMGNGFTFELESLLFWALCKECLTEEKSDSSSFSVYGDDIIVPTYAFEDVKSVLQFAGFSLNESKTFVSGPFRESCGKDYFHGHDVRPIFLKERISNVESVYRLANSIRRYSHSRNFNYGCDGRFLPVWSAVVRRLSNYFRDLIIPEGFGDVGLIGNFDEATPARAPNGWQGWMYKTLSRRPVKVVMRDTHGGYTTVLSVAGSEEPLLGFVSPRSQTYPKVARSHTWDWYDLGPWL